MRKFIIACCVLFSFGTQIFAVDFPHYENFVTDTSQIIPAETEAKLNIELKNYELKTGTEIAVVTVPLLGELSPNEYATQLGNTWGVGKTKVDNGVILLIETGDAPSQRDIYIATGSQLEGGLTDLAARDIVANVITPYFRAGDLPGGIRAGVTAIMLGLDGESFTKLRSTDRGNNMINIENLANIFFITIFVVLPWLAAILGRSQRVWPGGVIGALGGGLIGFLLIGSIFWIVIIAVPLGLLGLLFDAVVSRNYSQAKAHGISPAWWAGGRGGFGGGSGGFGGFGGGGFSGGGGGGKW